MKWNTGRIDVRSLSHDERIGMLDFSTGSITCILIENVTNYVFGVAHLSKETLLKTLKSGIYVLRDQISPPRNDLHLATYDEGEVVIYEFVVENIYVSSDCNLLRMELIRKDGKGLPRSTTRHLFYQKFYNMFH